MPYEYILANLLAENDGAVGVLFLDDSGETVDLACVDFEPSQMRLLGAYVGIYLRQVERFLEPEGFGEVKALHIESRGLHVFGKPIAEGYFLALAQRAPCLAAVTDRSLDRACEQLFRELFQPPAAAHAAPDAPTDAPDVDASSSTEGSDPSGDGSPPRAQ